MPATTKTTLTTFSYPDGYTSDEVESGNIVVYYTDLDFTPSAADSYKSTSGDIFKVYVGGVRIYRSHDQTYSSGFDFMEPGDNADGTKLCGLTTANSASVSWTGATNDNVWTIDTTQKKILINISAVQGTNLYGSNGKQVAFTAGTTVVELERAVQEIRTPAIDFSNASILTEQDLDNSAKNVFHTSQQAVADVESALKYNETTGVFEAYEPGTTTNKKIANVDTPTATTDAANKAYVDGSSNTVTVATNIANVNTVAGISGNVTTVAGISGNVTTVANDATDIGKVAGKETEIGKLGATAFADAPNGYLVKLGADAFSNASNGYIKKVADIDTNVTTVAGISANVTSVAGKSTEIDTIVNKYDGTTASSGTNKNLVQIDTVADAVANINTLATNISDINLVEDSITNVNAVAGSIAGSLTYAVTVATYSGSDYFYLDGIKNPTITLTRGFTYTFDQSAGTNSGHLLLFKDSAGNAYTNGVTSSGTLGQAGAKTVFVVPANAPDSLRYYCSSHGNNMGNTITVVNNDIGAVAAIGASSLNTVATNAESTAIVMGIALG